MKVPFGPGRGPGEVYIPGLGYRKISGYDEGVIYDTETVAPTSGTTLAGGTTYTFFRNINKDDRQSNMRVAGSLPANWEMKVLNIALHFTSEAVETDAEAIMQYGYATFTLDDSFLVKEGPMWLWPGGYGLWTTVDVDGGTGGAAPAATEGYVYQNGLPSKAGVPNLEVPVEITDDRTFQGRLQFFEDVTLSASAAAIDVCMYLYGILKRPAS